MSQKFFNDGRYIFRTRKSAKAVWISLSRMHFFLKGIQKERKISARWITNILTYIDRWQKRVRMETTEKLLKIIPKVNKIPWKWAHKTKIRQEHWLKIFRRFIRIFECYTFNSIIEHRKIDKKFTKMYFVSLKFDSE